MAKKTYLAQLHIATVGTLDTVPIGFVGLSAKDDGLYMKAAGRNEFRILNKEDLLSLKLGEGVISGQIQLWDSANEIWMTITAADMEFDFGGWAIQNINYISSTNGYIGGLAINTITFTGTKIPSLFLASPAAATGVPTFRNIAASDIPALPYEPQSSFFRVLPDRQTTNYALTVIQELQMYLTAGEIYEFEVHLGYYSSDTYGNNYGINFSGSAKLEASITGSATLTAGKTLRLNAFATSYGAFGKASAGSVLIKGIVEPSVSGWFAIQQQKAGTAGYATVYSNSFMRINKL